jgi:hypothetical protein
LWFGSAARARRTARRLGWPPLVFRAWTHLRSQSASRHSCYGGGGVRIGKRQNRERANSTNAVASLVRWIARCRRTGAGRRAIRA